MSPSRARATVNAEANSASCAEAITVLGGPGELGRGESGLALELDAEGVDP